MATNISSLKSTIINRISTNIDTIQDTANYERTTFRGFPAVTVTCSENENEYHTNAANMRTFAFVIRIYVNVTHKPTEDTISDNEKERAEGIMERVVSQIIDEFDEFYEFGGNADYCEAIPSRWFYTKIGNGWCRTAEIILRVHKEFLVR